MSARRGPTSAGRSKRSAGAGEIGREQATPLLEWTVGGLGAALLAGAIAFLVWHALARDRTPPDFRLVVERVLDLRNGYLVQFRAFNEGGSAAAEVTIEGELTRPDGEVETSEVVLDYMAPRSDRQGGLMFENDPRSGELQLRATGYARP
jgi:uncharacterized protein (TIGR02588 family)